MVEKTKMKRPSLRGYCGRLHCMFAKHVHVDAKLLLGKVKRG